MTDSQRKKNEKIGRDAEKRIVLVLNEKGARDVKLNSGSGNHPDVTFTFLEKYEHLVECKSLQPIYSCQVGSVHIRRTEIQHMAEAGDDKLKGLIVEVRPKGVEPYYYYLDWYFVRKQYEKRKPEIMSLSYHTIIRWGIELSHYFQYLNALRRASY